MSKTFFCGHVYLIELDYSVSLDIDHSHTSCQVRDDSVSHKKHTHTHRKNRQTYFFNPIGIHRDKAFHTLLLAIFTVICVRSNDEPLASSRIC